MQIKFIFVGKKSELDKFCNEYVKRLKAFVKIQLIYVKASIPKLEAIAIQKNIKKEDFVVVLDEHGHSLTSFDLSELVKNTDKPIAFIVGGAFGIDKSLFRNNLCLSLSQLTLPHAMARLIICETVYRCFTIINNLPYHKE